MGAMGIDSPLDLLKASTEELRAFLDLGLHETEVLDYKLNLGGDFAATVAAMANTDGGTIVVGVGENRERKTPASRDGFAATDPRGTLFSVLVANLDPVPDVETNVVSANADRVFLVVVVRPSTTRAVLHRQHGLRVRVGDESVAPNRSAFERLLERESTSGNEAVARRNSVSGRAALWAGPGAGEDDAVYVTVCADPIEATEILPTERLDDTLAMVATRLFGASFIPRAEHDRSAAERPLGGELLPDRLSLSRGGQLDVRLCAHRAGWQIPEAPLWLVDATQLAVEAIRCLIVPFALTGEKHAPNVIPAAAAMAFSGWGLKALYFPNAPRSVPGGPSAVRDARAPVLVTTLVQPSDVFLLARDAVRGLARFYGQRGADVWAESLAGQIRNAARLQPWMGALLG
jgi:hypothetical protein